MEDSENVNKETSKKWYDNKVIVGVLIFVFFPVGLYALWKSNTISKGWKVGWSLIIGLMCFAAIGSNEDLDTNSKNETLKSLNQESMKTFFDKTYKVNGGEETVEIDGKNFNRYSILSLSDNWVIHTFRTKNDELARVECADIGKKWNSDMLYVCNQVFGLIDKRIMEFADSTVTKHKTIDDMLVKTVSTDSSNVIIVDFKSFNPTLEVRDSPKAIYKFNTMEHDLRQIKSTDYVEEHRKNGLILDISGRTRKVYVNQKKWDSLNTKGKLSLVKDSNILIAGEKYDFTSPVYIENTFGEELAVYNNTTKKLKVKANKKSNHKNNTSQEYLTDQQKIDYIRELKRNGLILNFKLNRVYVNSSIWNSLNYNELQKMGKILSWWIKNQSNLDDSDPVFFESDSGNSLAMYNNETNSFGLY